MENILSQGGWWILNKRVTQQLGIDASLLLSDLIATRNYLQDRDMLEPDGSFYRLREQIVSDTTLSIFRKNEAMRVLIDNGLVKVKRAGIPAKTFYSIDDKVVNSFVDRLNKKPSPRR